MMERAASRPARMTGIWWRTASARRVVIVLLAVLLLAAAVVSVGIGAAGIPVSRLPAALGLAGSHSDPAIAARDTLVLWSIRLPRIVIALLIGGLLAVSGAIMQGLFCNPLADPALVGVSSGGALAAAAAIVAGDRLMAASGVTLPFGLLTVAAFIGSLVTTLILYRISTREGQTSVAIFLLGGLAIGAIANAGLGLLIFIADDRQLRDITFWMLGSLSGATWSKAAVMTPFLAALLIALPFISRGLDLLVLGESDAFHSGIAVERLKRICIVLVSAMVGAAVSFAGVIGFVGIVVPHLLRLVIGPSHAMLLIASTLLGAALLLVADTAARTIAAPAEVPIGILTALIGSPFFLFLLLRQRGLVGL
jgi:iron complex transport system permease protein